jgi:predicted DNA-binding antitoxin AbrB/MazE fold protein
MSLEIEAIYENGVLKPDNPLPLKEHQRVKVLVRDDNSITNRLCPLIPWTGDPEVLRMIAEDPEFGIQAAHDIP